MSSLFNSSRLFRRPEDRTQSAASGGHDRRSGEERRSGDERRTDGRAGVVDIGDVSTDSVIQLMSDLPEGVLLSGDQGAMELVPDRRDDHALLATSNNMVILLVSLEAYGRSVMFDLRSRVIKAGYTCGIRKATREIVKLCYEKSRSASVDSGGVLTEESEIERLITKIVSDAHTAKASDIHIETGGDKADVLFRVNGIRSYYGHLTRSTAQGLGSVMFTHADEDSKDVVWRYQEVADAALEWVTNTGEKVQLRFSSGPIYPTGNFHIVLRLLSMEAKMFTFEELGYTQEKIDMFDLMASGSNGMVLLCGPVNSGKSTALQAAIGRIYERRGREIKIITVEEPVEYVIPGACQIPVGRGKTHLKDQFSGSVFTTFLRGTLRQDPDLVMVGEIRDQENVMVTRDLVLSGRKVFATLHTSTALWAFIRLREIGLPWEILTMPGFIAGIIYQRLLPELCPECSRSVNDNEELVKPDLLHRLRHVVDMHTAKIRIRGNGCPRCKHSGFVGRAMVSEFVMPDDTLLSHLTANRFFEARQHWRAGGTVAGFGHRDLGDKQPITVLQDAIQQMSKGRVSPIDVENQIGSLTQERAEAHGGGLGMNRTGS